MRKNCGECNGVRQLACETLFRISTENKASVVQVFQEVSGEPELTEEILDTNQDLQDRLSAGLGQALGNLGCSLTANEIEQELTARMSDV